MVTDPDLAAPLTGRLLVATPALGESTFQRSVVLVLEHDEGGTLGVVINRPTAIAVAEVLPLWQPLASEPGVVFQGGPVAPDSALGLALVPDAGDDEPLGWRRVTGRLALVDLDVPPAVVAAELSRLRIFAGYSGWAAGQLGEELAAGAWYVLDADLDEADLDGADLDGADLDADLDGADAGVGGDVFSTRPARLWRDVLRRQGGELALVSTYLTDPSLN